MAEKKRMKILLSNDDGVTAPGLEALYRAFQKVGDVWVVAPMQEKSTTGHSLTIHKPLRLIEIDSKRRFFGVTGSPADCVYMGLRQVMKGTPDLVVSGVNRGGNLGQDVYYSGTVSAAREACILGLPAVAVSLAPELGKKGFDDDRLNYDTAARFTREIALKAIKKSPLPKHTLLNINVPDLPYSRVKGVTVTRQGFRHYSGNILRRSDHRGRDYFWVGGQYKGYARKKGTDAHETSEGFVSVTPIQLDCTNERFLDALSVSISK